MLWTHFDADGRATSKNVDHGAEGAVLQPRRLGDWEDMTPRGEIVVDVAAAREWAVRRIDAERAHEGEEALTPGWSVGLAYTRLGQEADDYASVSAAALALIDTAVKRRARFPWLVAQIEERGMAVTAVNLATVAGEVSAGKAASEAKVMRIEGKARRGKLAVRAATTLTAVLAAMQIDWSE